jgi:aminoglycoside phosphotransferase (APT) family kinase protein
MSDELRARTLRVLATMHEVEALKLRLEASMVEAAASMRAFVDGWQACMDHDLATHPDMAELNVQMDAWYTADYPKV